MKTVLVVGLGNFGMVLAKHLDALGHEVMAVDLNEEKVNEALPFVTSAQIGDATNVSFLKSLGVNNYDVCFVAIGDNFQNSLEVTYLLKEQGAKRIVARADRDVQAKFLINTGAEAVVNPEKQMAKWAARRYTSDHILDLISFDGKYQIIEVSAPKEWIGKTVAELDIRKKHGINILAFREEGSLDALIKPDDIFTEGKTMLVLGEDKAIHKCFHT